MRKIPIDAALAFSPYNKAVRHLPDGKYAIVEYLPESCLYSISVFDSNFVETGTTSHLQNEELYGLIDRQDAAWAPLTQDVVSSLFSDDADIPFGLPISPEEEQKVNDVLSKLANQGD